MDDHIKAVWVTGRYSGERARSVIAHAEAGFGYIILENTGNKMNPGCLAVTRIVPEATEGIPDHLFEVTDPMKIQKYEKIRKQRAGLDDHRASVRRASNDTVQSVAKMFEHVQA